MKIIIELNSPSEFPEVIQQFREIFSEPAEANSDTVYEIKLDNGGVVSAAVAEEQPKKKGGRPPKKPEPVEVPEAPPAAKVEAAAPVAETETEKEKVVSIFKAYFDKKGQEDCMKMLQGFGAQRISELPVEKYAEFIEKCNAELN